MQTNSTQIKGGLIIIIDIKEEKAHYLVYSSYAGKTIYLGIYQDEQNAKACKAKNHSLTEDITAKYYLLLSGGTVYLPNHYTTNERKTLCVQFIHYFKDDLTYHLPENDKDRTSEQIEQRLERLGDYLLEGHGVGKKDGLITEWAERVIAENETYLSRYDNDSIEI